MIIVNILEYILLFLIYVYSMNEKIFYYLLGSVDCGY